MGRSWVDIRRGFGVQLPALLAGCGMGWYFRAMVAQADNWMHPGSNNTFIVLLAMIQAWVVGLLLPQRYATLVIHQAGEWWMRLGRRNNPRRSEGTSSGWWPTEAHLHEAQLKVITALGFAVCAVLMLIWQVICPYWASGYQQMLEQFYWMKWSWIVLQLCWWWGWLVPLLLPLGVALNSWQRVALRQVGPPRSILGGLLLGMMLSQGIIYVLVPGPTLARLAVLPFLSAAVLATLLTPPQHIRLHESQALPERAAVGSGLLRLLLTLMGLLTLMSWSWLQSQSFTHLDTACYLVAGVAMVAGLAKSRSAAHHETEQPVVIIVWGLLPAGISLLLLGSESLLTWPMEALERLQLVLLSVLMWVVGRLMGVALWALVEREGWMATAMMSAWIALLGGVVIGCLLAILGGAEWRSSYALRTVVVLGWCGVGGLWLVQAGGVNRRTLWGSMGLLVAVVLASAWLLPRWQLPWQAHYATWVAPVQLSWRYQDQPRLFTAPLTTNRTEIQNNSATADRVSVGTVDQLLQFLVLRKEPLGELVIEYPAGSPLSRKQRIQLEEWALRRMWPDVELQIIDHATVARAD
ncbi:MAG: hypothetical protein HJJLKODD_01183 [Phycisphaerae bacterium]|nr:hypothetical protein [Phycisphaerae bacterium]